MSLSFKSAAPSSSAAACCTPRRTSTREGGYERNVCGAMREMLWRDVMHVRRISSGWHEQCTITTVCCDSNWHREMWWACVTTPHNAPDILSMPCWSSQNETIYIYIYIYIYVYTYIHMHIYIYIYMYSRVELPMDPRLHVDNTCRSWVCALYMSADV